MSDVADWRLAQVEEIIDTFQERFYAPEASEDDQRNWAIFALGQIMGMLSIPESEAWARMMRDDARC